MWWRVVSMGLAMALVVGALARAEVGLGYEPMRTASGERMAWPGEGRSPQWRLCGGSLVEALGEAGALAAWEGALVWWTAGEFLEGVDIEVDVCGLDGGDGRVAVVAVEGGWSGGLGLPAGLVGMTVHTFRVEDAQGAEQVATLLDADIALNVEGFLFSARAEVAGSFDVGAVVAHEMGHALGVGHPCGDGLGAHPSCTALSEAQLEVLAEGLMFPGQSVGARGLALSMEDVDGLRAVWGAQRVGVREGSARVGWSVCEDAQGGLRLEQGVGGDVRWRAVSAGAEGEWRDSAEALSPQAGTQSGFLIAAEGRGSAWRAQVEGRCQADMTEGEDDTTAQEIDALDTGDDLTAQGDGLDTWRDARGAGVEEKPVTQGEAGGEGCGCRVIAGARGRWGCEGRWALLGYVSFLGWALRWMRGWTEIDRKTRRGQ